MELSEEFTFRAQMKERSEACEVQWKCVLQVQETSSATFEARLDLCVH